MTRDVRLANGAFDVGVELARLQGDGVGAVASFTGIVRGDSGLTSLTLEHYPGMTEAALNTLADEATARWSLSGLILIHRIGLMVPGDGIVLTATASPHRGAALEACAYLIDRLKTDAPFWKKEGFADGREAWVDARGSDDAATARWG